MILAQTLSQRLTRKRLADTPLGRGNAATGGHLAAPIATDFLKLALADKLAVPFKVPAGIKLIRIVARTGMRPGPGDTDTILEAFKPGTAPPDNYLEERGWKE